MATKSIDKTSRTPWLLVLALAFLVHPALALVSNADWIKRILTNSPAWVTYETSPYVVFEDDLDRYWMIARSMHDGQVPYRDFVVEYPPLSIPVFWFPSLFTDSLLTYKLIFIAMILAFNATLVTAIARWAASRSGRQHAILSLLWYTVFFLLLSRLTIRRFDIIPALVTFLALTTWMVGRSVWGGILTTVATLVKLVPAMIAGPMGLIELANFRQSRLRGSIVFAVSLGIGIACWALAVGVKGVRGMEQFHGERGIELYSFYSGIQYLLARVTGEPFELEAHHFSWHTVTVWSPGLVRWAFPLQVGSLALAMVVFAVRKNRDPMLAFIGMLAGFIVFNKIGSPQYLIWIAPMVAVLEGPYGSTIRRLFAATCLITALAWLGKAIDGDRGLLFNSFVVLRGLSLFPIYVYALLETRGGRQEPDSSLSTIS